MVPTPLTQNQWQKVVKALAYSFGAGFITGLLLTLGNYLQSGKPLDTKLVHSLVIAAFVGGINALLVTIRQVFKEE